MLTLEEVYTEIASSPLNWSYYASPACNIQDKWKDDAEAACFIETYFTYAGKGKTVKNGILNDLKKRARGRLQHSISTFMLCLFLSDIIDGIRAPYTRDGFNEKYYLFLICLYHDIGYIFENKCRFKDKNTLQQDGLEAVQEIYNLQYIHDREFISYTREEIDIYLKGKLAETNPNFGGKPDHGIIGGLMLYDRLRKQFEYYWKHSTRYPGGRASFYCSGPDGQRLHLSNSHFDVYAVCADAIIAHNVFTDTLNRYLCDVGKQSHTEKVGTDVNPFLYMLALADSLEPMKRGIALDKIRIEKSEKNVSIYLDENIEKDVREKYFEMVLGLKSWMDIDVSVEAFANSIQLILG